MISWAAYVDRSPMGTEDLATTSTRRRWSIRHDSVANVPTTRWPGRISSEEPAAPQWSCRAAIHSRGEPTALSGLIAHFDGVRQHRRLEIGANRIESWRLDSRPSRSTSISRQAASLVTYRARIQLLRA